MCAVVHLNIQALSGHEHVGPVLLMYKSTFNYPYTRCSNAIYRCSKNITLHISLQYEIREVVSEEHGPGHWSTLDTYLMRNRAST